MLVTGLHYPAKSEYVGVAYCMFAIGIAAVINVRKTKSSKLGCYG